MIEGLQPYSEYKESDQRWLGRIPTHWGLLPNRALFEEVKDRNHPSEEMLSVTINRGIIRQQALLSDSSKKDSSNVNKAAYKLVQSGDIAYNKMRAWQGAIGASSFRGIISPAYVVMRPRQGCEPWYYHHLYRTPLFAKEAERWSYGITSDMWSLRPEHFKVIYSVQPPPDEQAAIVRFLDHANGKIERAIRVKRKLIALLNEQKQAIIHHAVTRGLDPNVKLKPSGIPWLGDVPEHWEVRRLKSLITDSVAGPYGSSLTKAMYVREGFRVYGQQQVISDNFKIGDYYISAEKFTLMDRYRVYPDDVLVSVMGTVGRVAVVPQDAEPGIINPRLVRYRPEFTTVRPRYLQLTMQAPSSRDQLVEGSKGTTMEGLNMGILSRLLLLIPPLDEQDEILSFVRGETTNLNIAIARTEREIALMQEYRTRLTADVVTGKLDVREAVKHLPEQTTDSTHELTSDDSEDEPEPEESEL